MKGVVGLCFVLSCLLVDCQLAAPNRAEDQPGKHLMDNEPFVGMVMCVLRWHKRGRWEGGFGRLGAAVGALG